MHMAAADARAHDRVEFMGLVFHVQPFEALIDGLIARCTRPGYGFVVTPNVDHVNKFHTGGVDRDTYLAAEIMVNDSKILEALASRVNKTLPATPGSDIVSALLHHPNAKDIRFAVVGPTPDDFALLKAKFPDLQLEFVPAAARLERGKENWQNVLDAVLDQKFDILLCCISFPKQEYLSYDLGQAGCTQGLSICAGASIDFLTGRQKRAPQIFQTLRAEWLYRLLGNPRRLARRYLIEGPRIFRLFWSLEKRKPQA